MYSLNVPVPGQVERLAADLHPYLTAFERIRERHSLVLKRFEIESLARIRERLRNALLGAPAFEARVTGIDYFAEPTSGSAPVLYLIVESPGLWDVHRRLVDEFGAIEELEGDDYTPHVTLARQGSLSDAQRLAEREIEPIEWTVSELQVWDPQYSEITSRITLPQ